MRLDFLKHMIFPFYCTRKATKITEFGSPHAEKRQQNIASEML